MTWTTLFVLPQSQDLAHYCIRLHPKKESTYGKRWDWTRALCLRKQRLYPQDHEYLSETKSKFLNNFSRLKRRLLDLLGLHPSFQLRVSRLHRLLQDLLPGRGHRPLLRLGSLASYPQPHRTHLCAKKRCTNGRRWEQKRLHGYGTSHWTSYTDKSSALR